MPKRKCKFTAELQAKYPCFRAGREGWEAECLVCQEGTYVSVANKGSLDLEAHIQSMKHQRNVLGDTSGAKTGCFLPADCQPFAAAPTADAETSLGFLTSLLQGSKDSRIPGLQELQNFCEPLVPSPSFSRSPAPILDALGLQLKAEARMDEALAPFLLDPLNGVPYCGVALGSSEVGTPFPIRICYFDWKQGGLQSKVITVESPLGQPASMLAWEALESQGLGQRCVAVVGDSPNAVLGGVGSCSQACGLRELLGGVFIATDCPGRLLSNCIQHGADSLEVDLQSLLWKLYTYAAAYSLHTQPLEAFWEFARRESRRLLRHATTPWLVLLPAINHLLQVFPALKSFFLSLSHPPFAIRTFLEDPFSEIYLQHMASQVAVFEEHLKALGREGNSPCEVLGVLSSLHHTLLERRAHGFMSPRVKELLEEQRGAGRVEECDTFCHHVQTLYVAFLDYLGARVGPFGDLSHFQWMQLWVPPTWAEVEDCITFLAEHGVLVDSTKCFDQFCHLTTFLKDQGSCQDFSTLQTHQKWVRFFSSSSSLSEHSELLRMAQVFFAIPSLGADFPRELLQM